MPRLSKHSRPGPAARALAAAAVVLAGYAMGDARPAVLLYLSGALLLASLATLLPQGAGLRGLLTALLGLTLGLYLAGLTVPDVLPAALATSRPELTNAAFKAVWVMTAVLVGLVAGWSLRDLGVSWGRPSPLWWLAGAAVAAAVLVYYRHLYQPPAPLPTNLPPAPVQALGICIFFGVSNALAEEYLFRRLAQTQLVRSLGPAWGVACQAVLYGLTHLGPSSRPSGPGGALAMALAAWFLGRGTQATGGLALAVAVHALIDTFIFWWG